MKRTSTTKPTSSTHFEQIPLAIVKSIARAEVTEGGKSGTKGVAVERAPEKKAAADGGRLHAVQFYTDSDALCRIVGHFIREGLDQGAVGVLIVTPDHATRIEACLRTSGMDVDALKRLGTLVVFDARETLELFMRNGMPNHAAFRHAIGTMLTEAGRGQGHCAIRAYGEMVDLLWKDGLEAAAIRLETLWNQLTSTHDFDLLCGYAMGNFYKGMALDEIRYHHTHLAVDGGHAAVFQDLHPAVAPN